jgi:hypothetical protein
MSFRHPLPGLRLVRQKVDSTREVDISAAVKRELDRLKLGSTIKPGESIALTAGSRGIANIPTILRATVEVLRSLGAKPFIVPAMGSHGGGTAEGQREVLASYGITEAAVNAPIRASMEVVRIGDHPEGGPVYIDRIASQADHIGIVARVKPHTSFQGSIESGLVKMMMIGLGKHEGAKEYHRILVRQPWEPFARSIAPIVLAKTPVRFGLAIVENALDETAHIEGVPANQFLEREPALLRIAKRHMPRLPVDEVDLLIIDEIGKDISGSGADTNVIGRKPSGDVNERDVRNTRPLVHRIFMRELSHHSHGNAAGIGLADFTTDRLVASMDYPSTVINCLTANHPLAAAVPIHFPSDREVIDAAIGTVGLKSWTDAHITWIIDTLRVEYLAVTATYDLSRMDPAVEVITDLPWKLDEKGNLPKLAQIVRENI